MEELWDKLNLAPEHSESIGPCTAVPQYIAEAQ